jgi:trehalose utilization protein
MSSPRVTIWHEHRHESDKKKPLVKKTYPKGMHVTIADGLRGHGIDQINLATLDDPQHGLSEKILAKTDVLIWWGHGYHNEVKDAIVERVQKRVLEGMGLIVLHSGHFSKIFRKLMGTTCNLKWRESGDEEVLWVTKPGHPITAGLGDHFVIPNEEMYGEFFDVPEPDETIFISSFSGSEVFRSGLTYTRGKGRIFYFRPGHETFPTYYQKEVIQVIANAVGWAAQTPETWTPAFSHYLGIPDSTRHPAPPPVKKK